MSLHPEIARILATLPAPPPGPLDPAAMRADEESHVAPLEERLPLHAVEDTTAPTAYGDVPVRVYTPTAEPAPGVLVYLHGGAFFLGSLETHDHVARALAQATGLKVVSVGYRRAPEAAYPAGLEDCYGVVRWVGETLDLDAPLVVAGDSSGGTFVAAVTATARDDGWNRITHQVLYYPSLDLDFDEDMEDEAFVHHILRAWSLVSPQALLGSVSAEKMLASGTWATDRLLFTLQCIFVCAEKHGELVRNNLEVISDDKWWKDGDNPDNSMARHSTNGGEHTDVFAWMKEV
jgi:acetyl esterase/lipase